MNFLSQRVQKLSESETLAMARLGNELKEKGKSVIVPSGGGSDDIKELEEIKNSYNELFDSMYSKYIELLAKYNDSKTPEECQKDLKVIQEKLDNEETKVAKSEEKIRKISDKKKY